MSTPNKRELVSKILEGINRLARVAYLKSLPGQLEVAISDMETAESALSSYANKRDIPATRARFVQKVSLQSDAKKRRSNNEIYVDLIDRALLAHSDNESVAYSGDDEDNSHFNLQSRNV